MPFVETQRFTQWWIMWVYFGLFGLVLFAIIKWYFFKEAIGNVKPTNYEAQIGLYTIISIVTVLLLMSKLETRISEKGIAYRFFPFDRNFRLVSWQEMESCAVKSIRTYGIHGYRINRLSIAGNSVVQIDKKDGSTIHIGTQKGKEVRGIIKIHLTDKTV